MQLFHHYPVKISWQLLKVSSIPSCLVLPRIVVPLPSLNLIVFLAVASIHESSNLAHITAALLSLGVVATSCGFLFSITCICYCVIIQRRKTLKRKDEVSKHLAAVSQNRDSDTWRSRTTFGLLSTFKDIILQ